MSNFLSSKNIPLNDSAACRVLNGVELGGGAALLLFTPLALGATADWALAISLWLGLVFFGAMALRRLGEGASVLPCSQLDRPLAVALIIGVVSWAVSIYRGATLPALLHFLLYVAVFYTTLDIVRSRKQMKGLILLLMGMGAFVSFLGLVEYSGAPFPDFWKSGPVLSVDGPFINRNHMAGYLQMIFALGLGVFAFRSMMTAAFWVPCLVLMLVALFLTLSRGGWIGVFVATEFILVGFFLRKRVSPIKVGGVALVLFLVAAVTVLASNPVIERLHSLRNVEVDGSWTARLSVWKACWQLVTESPVWGWGLGTFPWAFTRVRPAGLTHRYMEAHNDYIQIVVEMGLPILIPLLWGVSALFKAGMYHFRSTSSRFQAGTAIGAMGGILGILVHSLGDFNLQITANGILFSCLMGIAVGEADITHERINVANGGEGY